MEKDTETDSESFVVLEMPVGLKSIRMDTAELRRLCREYRLPVFSLKVQETVSVGVAFPHPNPYRKIFTLKWDWCLWAAEKIGTPAPDFTQVELQAEQLEREEYEQLPADADGEIGFRRKDGKAVIV